MSGRDFRSFLASHHSQIGQPDNRLVTRFLSGQKPLYKEVDYDKLQALTKLKHSSGQQSLKKIDQLTRKNEEGKVKQLLFEHRRIWEKEIRRLKDEEIKINNELSLLRLPSSNFDVSTSSFNKQLFEDIDGYEISLKQDLPDFIEKTIQPIKDLSEDINYYVENNRNEIILGVQNNDDIIDTIGSVKQQQDTILQQLDTEQNKLEEELECYMHSLSLNNNVLLPEIKIGIPSEVLFLECPDESLKESCLSEFETLDEKYVSRLESLEENYDAVLRKAPFGNWDMEDHFCFCHIMNQYGEVTKNRRKLYMDCLQRILKHMTLKTITNHEEWWLSYKSFRRQIKDLFHAWKRDREDLILQVISLFHEATAQYRKKQNEMVDHMKQKFVCNYLHEKLVEYQTERLELLKLEEVNRAAIESEIQRKLRKKTLAEENRREKDKQRILARKEQHAMEMAVLSEKDHNRMIELQEKRALQRVYDEERVQYRQEKYNEKISSELLKKQLAEEEAVEKERRLQLIRDQVVVEVDDDPTRIYEHTEAYKARVAVPEYEEKDVQEPLFKVYTYSVDQIAQDKRLKVENALRRANVHMTDYGRHIMSTVLPPSKPRKDLQSTVFKSD